MRVCRLDKWLLSTEPGLLDTLGFLISTHKKENSMIKNYLWTLPFLLFITGYIGIQLLLAQPEVETPSLVGNSIHDAITLLSHNNLNARILSEKEDADF